MKKVLLIVVASMMLLSMGAVVTQSAAQAVAVTSVQDVEPVVLFSGRRQKGTLEVGNNSQSVTNQSANTGLLNTIVRWFKQFV